jgi:hypothetical protein
VFSNLMVKKNLNELLNFAKVKKNWMMYGIYDVKQQLFFSLLTYFFVYKVYKSCQNYQVTFKPKTNLIVVLSNDNEFCKSLKNYNYCALEYFVRKKISQKKNCKI